MAKRSLPQKKPQRLSALFSVIRLPYTVFHQVFSHQPELTFTAAKMFAMQYNHETNALEEIEIAPCDEFRLDAVPEGVR
jgi:hypothetical protein